MRKSLKKINLKIVLIVSLLLITIGYASLQANLNINGTSIIANARWDIHFENVQVNNHSVPIETGDSAAIINPSDNTEVLYSISLKQPGDFYEFTVDAVNEGTIDAMIESVSSKLNNVEITTLPNHLEYSVAYEDDIAIAPNHLLEAGSSETYKVRIAYKKDINPEDLPSTDETLNLLFTVTYVQADENAVVSHQLPTAAEILISKYNEGDNEEGLILENTDEYRYSGANVKNYVNFNNEEWRIIGIFNVERTYQENGVTKTITEPRIKIMKMTSSMSSTWYISFTCDMYNDGSGCINTWSSSNVASNLNNNYLSSAGYQVFSLSDISKNMIDNAIWYVNGASNTHTTVQAYQSERSGATWEGKVGLLYPSDYGYASTNCRNSMALSSYDNTTCFNSNWISSTVSIYTYWLMAPYSPDIRGALILQSNSGEVTLTRTNSNVITRPVVYLKSNVLFSSTSGDGSSMLNPYVFELNN